MMQPQCNVLNVIKILQFRQLIIRPALIAIQGMRKYLPRVIHGISVRTAWAVMMDWTECRILITAKQVIHWMENMGRSSVRIAIQMAPSKILQKIVKIVTLSLRYMKAYSTKHAMHVIHHKVGPQPILMVNLLGT